MGHHAEHVASGAADAGDIFERSIGIRFWCDFTAGVRITEDDAIVALQFGERRLIAKIIAFHVADGDGQHFALAARVRKRGFVVFDFHLHRLADIFQSDVAHQRSRQQSRLTQNLEAVADAEDQSASGGELADGVHHWGELGDGAGAEIVTEGETSGDDDGVAVLEVVRVVPEKSYGLLGDLLDGPESIVIAVRSGENNDAKFHRNPRVKLRNCISKKVLSKLALGYPANGSEPDCSAQLRAAGAGHSGLSRD